MKVTRCPYYSVSFLPNGLGADPAGSPRLHPKPASTDQTTPATRGNPARPGGENVANLQQASIVGFPLRQAQAYTASVLREARRTTGALRHRPHVAQSYRGAPDCTRSLCL